MQIANKNLSLNFNLYTTELARKDEGVKLQLYLHYNLLIFLYSYSLVLLTPNYILLGMEILFSLI